MRITANRHTILAALAQVEPAISTRTSLPILTYVLLGAADGALALTATDLEVAIRTSAPATVERPGGVALSPQYFRPLLEALPDDRVVIDVDERNIVHLASGRFTAELSGLPADEFPVTPMARPDEAAVAIDAAHFLRAYRRVRPAANAEEWWTAQSGILLVFADARLTLVATDSKRLAIAHLPVEECPPNNPSYLVPVRALDVLADHVIDGAGQFALQAAPQCAHSIRFTVAQTVLSARLLDGPFPDYAGVIPNSAERTARVDRQHLLAALRCARAVPDTEGKVLLTFAPGTLTVSASVAGEAEMEEAVEADMDGPPGQIAYNANYLIDALACVWARDVTIATSAYPRPAVIRVPGNDAYMHLVMPMKPDKE